jgi:hypothetical protein
MQHISSYTEISTWISVQYKVDRNITSLMEILNNAYAKCYEGGFIFKEYIPKKYNHFSIEIYKLCDKSG